MMSSTRNEDSAKLIDAHNNNHYSNAMKLSVKFGFDYVEGWLILPLQNTIVDYAWNIDEFRSDIIDTTIIENSDPTRYFEVHRYTKEELLPILVTTFSLPYHLSIDEMYERNNKVKLEAMMSLRKIDIRRDK
jgi:uncharacterized protein (UPF0276 family)